MHCHPEGGAGCVYICACLKRAWQKRLMWASCSFPSHVGITDKSLEEGSSEEEGASWLGGLGHQPKITGINLCLYFQTSLFTKSITDIGKTIKVEGCNTYWKVLKFYVSLLVYNSWSMEHCFTDPGQKQPGRRAVQTGDPSQDHAGGAVQGEHALLASHANYRH